MSNRLIKLRDGLESALQNVNLLIEELHPEINKKIEDVVCKDFMINKHILFSKTQRRDVVSARNVVIWYKMNYQRYTVSEICKVLNVRRGFVYSSMESIENLINTDTVFASKIDNILTKMNKT